MASISEEIIRALKGHAEVSAIERTAPNSWNYCYKLRDGDNFFFLKVYSTRRGIRNRPANELSDVYRFLSATSLEARKNLILPILLDGRYVASERGQTFSLFPWVDNNVFKCLQEDREQPIRYRELAIDGLGRFHELFFSSYTHQGVVSGVSICLDPLEWGEAVSDLVRVFQERLRASGVILKSSFALEVEGASIEVVSILRKIIRVSDFGFIHGDYRPENLFIDERNRNIRICDFDLARHGLLDEDIIYAALCYCGPRWIKGDRNWGCFWSFIDDYRMIRYFANDERVFVVLIWVLLKWIINAFKKDQILDRFKVLFSAISFFIEHNSPLSSTENAVVIRMIKIRRYFEGDDTGASIESFCEGWSREYSGKGHI